MIYNIVLYINTGLVPGNSLESFSSLELFGFETMTPPDCALKQSKGVTNLRVATTYDKVIAVDYCSINKVCYWVTNIEMLNDNVALLTLSLDYMTTVGVSNIEIIAGWCTRRTVEESEDKLFSNVLEEPFTPLSEFKMDIGDVLFHRDMSNLTEWYNLGLVVTSSDLSDESGYNVAKFWKYEDPEIASAGVFTPAVSPIGSGDETRYFMTFWERVSNIAPVLGESTVPFTCAFSYDNDLIGRNISTIYSLGLDSTIRESYSIPSEWIDSVTYISNDGSVVQHSAGEGTINGRNVRKIIDIYCDDKVVSSSLYPKFNITLSDGSEYVVRNNKCYTGQFQKISLVSLTSGETIQFDADEIYDNSLLPNDTFKYRSVADLRYVGKPMIYPKTYHKSENKLYLGSISGSVWQGLSILSIGTSGGGMRYQDELFSSLQSLAGGFGSKDSNFRLIGSRGSNIVPLQASYDREYSYNPSGVYGSLSNNMYNQLFGSGYYARKLPTIHLAEVPSMQNYFGNRFIDYRMRLSDDDMIRFDNFLTQFGYAVNDKLLNRHFWGRSNFNFVKADDVLINIKYSTELMNSYSQGFDMTTGVIRAIESGIRVWHVRPNKAAMYYNPFNNVPEGV